MIGRTIEVGCTIEIENSFDSLHAHVELDGDIAVGPGDRVRVHGDAIVVPYGSKMTLRRTATLTRAGALEKAWTRLKGDIELLELCEVTFSSGGRL